jgi:hypothetical protein
MVSEARKIWNENNKEMIIQKRKEYYEKNKERMLQNDKARYEKNKEKKNNRAKEKVTCECGAIICRREKTPHEKTRKHKSIIENTTE